ncbi:MAG: nucleotidyltransferase family protein [Candidatus Hodarchaeales archaeon]
MAKNNISRDIYQFLKENKSLIQEKYHVRELGLFGSSIKGEYHEKSDIDVLVVFLEKEETFKNYMKLKFFLEDSLNRKVDLVIKNTLKPMIKEKILNEVVYA